MHGNRLSTMRYFYNVLLIFLLVGWTSAILDPYRKRVRSRGGTPVKIPEEEEDARQTTTDGPSRSEVVVRPWFSQDDHSSLFDDITGAGEAQSNWWKGPNVCNRTSTSTLPSNGSFSPSNFLNIFNQFSLEVSTGGRNKIQNYHFVSISLQCEALTNAHRCVTIQEKNLVVERSVKIYECCPGYSRKLTSNGCTEKFVPKPLNLALDDLDLSILHEAFDSLKINWVNKSDATKKSTIFAPPKATLEQIKLNNRNSMSNNVLEITPELMEEVNKLRHQLAGHVVQGYLREADIHDGLVVYTSANTSIRIAVSTRPAKSHKFVTANCVPVTSFDSLATNGVIHQVSSLLPLNKFSLLQLISTHPQLTTLYKLIVEHKAEGLLNSTDEKPISVFAPTDAAFKEMDLSSNKLCFTNFLKSLIMEGHLCLTSVFGQSKLKDFLANQRSVVAVYSNETQLLVGHRLDNRIDIVESDVVASQSGVLHLIGKVEVSDQAMSYKELAYRMKSNAFMDLVEKAEKAGFNAPNATILFLPTEHAMQNIPKEYAASLNSDSKTLLSFVNFHFFVATLPEEKRIRMKGYHTAPYGRRSIVTAECKPVMEKLRQSCDQQIYSINSVFMPPSTDLLGEMRSRGETSEFVTIIEHANLVDFVGALTSATILAPSNEAIQYLGRSFFKQLKGDKEKAALFVKQHIVKGIVCCSGILEADWLESNPNSQTYANQPIRFERRRNQLYVAKNSIQSCGDSKLATNGVIHVISRAIPLARATRPTNQNVQNIWSFLEALMNQHMDADSLSSDIDLNDAWE